MEKQIETISYESPAKTLLISVSIIVPTLDEKENIEALVAGVDKVLTEPDWELIIVDDDSSDGTADFVRHLSRSDRRLRLISRHNRRGLSTAVVEGVLAASGEIVVVMDGDLQHDEALLPLLIETIRAGDADIASASRFLVPEGISGLSSSNRLSMSRNGTGMANRCFRLNLTDPLTGFFAIRRDIFVAAIPYLSELGYKILLDIVVSSPTRLKVVEMPFILRTRMNGTSKLDGKVLFEFLLFFIDKTLGRYLPVPIHFLSFSIIGGLGVFVHMAILAILYSELQADFMLAQGAATAVALVFNFTLNNSITYFDQRLHGWAFTRGLLLFAALCSVGIVANVSVATIMHNRYESLIYIVPALCGILISVSWNFAATNLLVWKK